MEGLFVSLGFFFISDGKTEREIDRISSNKGQGVLVERELS